MTKNSETVVWGNSLELPNQHRYEGKKRKQRGKM